LNQQQRDYLEEHLPYMLKMLRYTYGQMLQKQHYLSWNAHFESFAVHARNLVNFLTNNDTGNCKASEFVQGYRARIGDDQGAMTKLREQVFHLGKKRPRHVVDKFNTEHAKKVYNWIEKNFADFLSELGDLRPHFDDRKADPAKDEAAYITTGPTGPGAYACTASIAVQTSDDMGKAIRKITDQEPK
jgi:hypothetical protein